MNQTAVWATWLIAAYLAGSIPFGLLIGRLRGVDVRRHGSGNVGATNVGRVVGRPWGILCFALDVAKGLLPVLAYSLAAGAADAAAVGSLSIAAMAVVGHIFPVWLRFRGGKGVATGMGALLGLWPVLTIPALLAGGLWLIVVLVTAYVSLASVAAAAALPALALASTLYHRVPAGQAALYVGVTTMLAALVIFRHRTNLAKLRAGTETRAAWARRA